MGQLEAYGVNEIYLTGMMVGLFGTYLIEELESCSFESYKPYFYSAAFASLSKKLKKIPKLLLVVSNNEGAKYRSVSYFGLNKTIAITKLIDNFLLWQDKSLIDFRVDNRVLKLQDKYYW